MAFLVVGGLTIPIQPGNAQRDWSDNVDRSRAFDNTYRASATGGGVRDWHFTTPPVTRALADTYEATLRLVGAQICSGDVLGITMMCCAEIDNGWSAIKSSSSHLVSLPFTLHEVQPATLLLRYAVGDTITGESFTRSTTAFQVDTTGLLVSKAINTKRDGHFTSIGGTRSLLLEDVSTNLILQSEVLQTSWTASNTTISVNATTAPDGATTAEKIVETTFNGNHAVVQSTTNGVATYTASCFFKAAERSRVVLGMSDNTGGGAQIGLDLATGITFATGVGAGSWTAISSKVIALASGWYRLSVTATRGAGTVTILQIFLDNGTTISYAGDITKGLYAWGGQIEAKPFASSYIPTTTVAVTRGADFYSFPFLPAPQEMTAFVKYVDLGTALTAAAFVFDISNAANTGARFLSHNNSGLTAYHHNGGAPVESAGLAAATFGNVVELATRLYGDGSVDATQSLNGAAATASPITGAQSLPAAWSGQLAWLNSPGTVAAFNGFGAYQSFKIVGGARSLTEMRGA